MVHGDAARQKAAKQQGHLAQVAIGWREIGQAALGFAHELGGVWHGPQGDAARSRLFGRPSAEQEVDGRRECLAFQIADDSPGRRLLA